jgi:hypothetical protein
MDKRGFRGLVAKTHTFRFFLDMFEREDAEVVAHRAGGTMRPNMDRETRSRRQRR